MKSFILEPISKKIYVILICDSTWNWSIKFLKETLCVTITNRKSDTERGGERQSVFLRERVRRNLLCDLRGASNITDYIIMYMYYVHRNGNSPGSKEYLYSNWETNMVILFSAYLAYFSLTNQSREVICDFDFVSDAGDGYDD